MAANLHLVLIAVLTLFGVFVAALGYAQLATQDLHLTAATADRRPRH